MTTEPNRAVTRPVRAPVIIYYTVQFTIKLKLSDYLPPASLMSWTASLRPFWSLAIASGVHPLLFLRARSALALISSRTTSVQSQYASQSERRVR